MAEPHQPYPTFKDAMEYLRQLNKELTSEDDAATPATKKPPPLKPKPAGIHLVPFHPAYDQENMVAVRCLDGTLTAGVMHGKVFVPHCTPCPETPEKAPLLRLRFSRERASKEKTRRFLDTDPVPDTTWTPPVTIQPRHFPRPRQSCAANS